MNTLIIYDSLYGNTEKIARAIGSAMNREVKTIRAKDANLSDLQSVNLLIVGSPTHGGRPSPATKEFLDKIPAGGLNNVKVASFDTRIEIFFAKIFGYAAGRIAKILESKGGQLVSESVGFIVKGKDGPLKEGELERAVEWVKTIN